MASRSYIIGGAFSIRYWQAGFRPMILERGAALIVGAALIAALAGAGIIHDPIPLFILAGLGTATAVLLVEFPGKVPPGWAVSVSALIAVFELGLLPPIAGVLARTPSLVYGFWVGGATMLLVALLPLLPAPRRFAFIALAGMEVSFAFVILGGRPFIDVWTMLGDAGNGLMHGLNPYELSFPEVPPGQDDYCFPYVPGAFLLTAPAQVLFGDVRWMESACLLATVGLIWWHGARHNGLSDGARSVSAALLVGAMPGTLHVVEGAWTEPLVLLPLVAGAVLIDRGRPGLAIVPLAVALATKQYLVVLLPLLAFWPSFGWRRLLACGALAGGICLPWLLANPARFVACTVGFHVFLAPFTRSMSTWLLLPTPLRGASVVLGLLVSYTVVAMRAPRTGAGFLVGVGVVLAVFDLTNKATFLNEWWLAAELVVAGLAIAGAGTRSRKGATAELG